jgi:hypothetical protein
VRIGLPELLALLLTALLSLVFLPDLLSRIFLSARLPGALPALLAGALATLPALLIAILLHNSILPLSRKLDA